MTRPLKSRHALGLALVLGGIALAIGDPAPSGPDGQPDVPVPKTGPNGHADSALVNMDRLGGDTAGETPRVQWTAAAEARLAAAYRSDQVLVAMAEGASIQRLARRHGLTVLRPAGRSGFGALGLPAGASLGARMAALHEDSDTVGVLPNAVVRGASDAAKLQEEADKELAKAAELEAIAQAAERQLDALLEAGASAEDIEHAREVAEDARERADKTWREADERQRKADERAKLEYRAQIRESQLHLKCSNHPKYREDFDKWEKVAEPDYSGFTVAVLDTGVAYADVDADGTAHVSAPSLRTSPIVAPIDVVNADTHAGDDHQHGTHIASIIASSGDLVGLAPGVGLMPVKVLDAHNQGTELDLVEGIHHAVDNGADIINLSLSFGEGYMPSRLLTAAIARAREAGVVLVAASGNKAEAPVSWPAASPQVIAVTSAGIDNHRKVRSTPYASYAPEVDITAMGGILGHDLDGDGFDDGILAETIMPGDPSQTGYWFYAGTSQAAAVVSGALVRLMAMGATAEESVRLLQMTADDSLDGNPYESGWGAGTVDLSAAETSTLHDGDRETVAEPHDHFVSIHPYIKGEPDKDQMEARARIMVVDAQGEPVQGIEVMGEVRGSQTEAFSCKTDGDGECTVKLDNIEAVDAQGNATDPGMAWVWTVRALYDSDLISSRFSGLLYASEGLEAVTAAQHQLVQATDAALAIYWPPGTDDEELGKLAESYTILSAEAGAGTAPMAIAMTPAVLEGVAHIARHQVGLDGSGIATSPFGLLDVRLVSFDGAGISTSPFGFTLPPLFAIDGSGISTSPFGLHPLGITQPLGGSGISTSPFGFQSNPILLSSGAILGASAEDSQIAKHLATGGWSAEGGQSAAGVLAASGLLDGEGSRMTPAEATGSSVGPGDLATPVELATVPLPEVEAD